MYLSVYLSYILYRCIYLYFYLYIHIFIYLYIHISIYLSIYLSVYVVKTIIGLLICIVYITSCSQSVNQTFYISNLIFYVDFSFIFVLASKLIQFVKALQEYSDKKLISFGSSKITIFLHFWIRQYPYNSHIFRAMIYTS